MKNKSQIRRHFASDNHSGICPEAFAAMAEANAFHETAYGNDSWTTMVSEMIRDLFETDCEIFFVFNGTAANSLALASLCQSYHSIICHNQAHIETSECGAPEFFGSGSKILLVGGENGKLDLAGVEAFASRPANIHFPKPRVLSFTQPTELGTVYSVDELRAVHEVAQRHHLRVHMDGARFANAIASLGVAPKEITWRVGVDVLCFGGTKNGIAVGEAVVFFNKELAREFDYRCKQGGQLASKMRFLSAPWAGMLKDGAWLKHARHSNEMARLLEAALRKIPGVNIAYPVQSNAVFAKIPASVAGEMHAIGWKFYNNVGPSGDARLMCSWDTTPQDIESFTADLEKVMTAQPAG